MGRTTSPWITHRAPRTMGSRRLHPGLRLKKSWGWPAPLCPPGTGLSVYWLQRLWQMNECQARSYHSLSSSDFPSFWQQKQNTARIAFVHAVKAWHLISLSLQNTSIKHTVAWSDMLLNYQNTHTRSVVYFESIPHTLPRCRKYSQNPQLKIFPNKHSIQSVLKLKTTARSSKVGPCPGVGRRSFTTKHLALGSEPLTSTESRNCFDLPIDDEKKAPQIEHHQLHASFL